MDGQELLNGFELHNDRIFHEQIDPVSTAQLEALVTEGQMNLTSEGKAHSAQFTTDAFLIRRFEQAGAQMPMNLNRGGNDPMRDLVKIGCVRSCVTLHFSSLRLSLRLCVSAVNSH